ncbi:uncharacterized protein LOC124168885 isoform X1 [Ischnura elegans]|uniref:uncharacterized protein LOC124168885 isoform X1 n=1 Tax=Ischnura elegans TaxID=197161 RepID=UPI001ED8758F|nr:uncharacterized protein LOC124168885 isoform X1 [Ischnura elegans]
MANVNLSLDEIIQKKFKFSSNKGRGRGRGQAGGVKRTGAAQGRGRGGATSNKTGVAGRVNQGNKAVAGGKVAKTGGGNKPAAKRGDARLTIIAKKRLKLSDARDRLAEIAKQSGDAREKLTQLRRTKLVNQSVGSTAKASWAASGAPQLDPLRTVRGGNITVRKGRNGRISLSTKRNVEMMWKPVSKPSWDWGKGNIAPYHDLDDPGENISNVPSLGIREPLSGADYANAELVPSHSLLLRRTVNNDQMHTSRPPPMPPLPPSVHSYRGASSTLGPSADRGPMGLQALSLGHPWAKGNTSPRHYSLRGHPPRPPIVPSKRQGMSLLLSEREEWGGGGGEVAGVASSYQGSSAIASKRNTHAIGAADHMVSGKSYMEDEVMRLEDEDDAEDDAEEEEYALMGINARKAGRISRELKARLDIPPATTSGQLAPFQRPANSQLQRAPTSIPNDSTASQQRYKVRVSNLQPTVTQEDIRELFEDIGPLACPPRLLPPPSGEAIVCFRERSDAARAVDVYHLRQLDGQPMRCSLISPSSTTTSSNNVKSSGGSSNPLHAASSRPSMSSSSSTLKLPSGGKTPVMPDIATIHKALFNKA